MSYSDELEPLRAELNLIDAQLAGLVDARMAVSAKIGELKVQYSRPIFDYDREQEIITRVGLNAKYPADARDVYRSILQQSQRIQHEISLEASE